ncbi:hypothetical protein RN001_009077 [Aquatica leii]|uniref:Uncharacterized protein n=1 Tax=Aquatica leii TaxID=1421715 RepID=A0AAN7S804_9COLE|nr:hypothetical protein RN001_009077 [Aquatica leii]
MGQNRERVWYYWRRLQAENGINSRRISTRKRKGKKPQQPKQEVPNADGETPVAATHNESTPAEPRPKKRKEDPKLHMLKEAFAILKSAYVPQEVRKETHPEVASSVAFIGEKMKSYSTATKNMVQQEIFQILVRVDQGYYEGPPGHPQYSGDYPAPTPNYYHQPVRSIPTGLLPHTTPIPSTSTSTPQHVSLDEYLSSPGSEMSEVNIEELI